MPIVLHNEGDTPKGIYVVRDYYIKFVFVIKTLIKKPLLPLLPYARRIADRDLNGDWGSLSSS